MSAAAIHNEPQLIVGRWQNTYFVPTDHPDPESLRQRLDHEFRTRAADVATHALAAKLDPTDPSVWRIRRLDLTFAVVDNGAEEVLAQMGGRQLAAQLSHVISRPEANDSVLRFPNRAAFLARFARDLALGRAWGKWYYEEFDSLAALPVSAAIRETFLREHEYAAATLKSLTGAHQLEEVLAVLTDHDAALIFDGCFENEIVLGVVPSAWIERLLKINEEIAGARSACQTSSSHDALRFFVRMCESFPESENSRLRDAINGFLEMHRILASVQPGSVSDVSRHLERGEFSSIAAILHQQAVNTGVGLDFLQQVLAAIGSDVPSLARLLPEDKAFVKTAGVSSQFLSSFAGIFLLGPSFLDLDVDSIAAALARNTDEPEKAASVFRHLVAIQAFGRTRAALAAGDEAMRLFSGFNGAAWAHEFAALDIAEANFESAQLVLVENLVARQRCDGSCLLVETICHPFSSKKILLIRDVFSDEWLRAVPLPDEGTTFRAAIEKAIQSLSTITGKTDLLLLRGGLTGLQNDFKNLAGAVIAAPSGEAPWPDELALLPRITPEAISRARASAEAEFEACSLFNVWPDAPLAGSKDLTGALVARAVLKDFARRLTGFAASGAEYLYQNFLSGAAAVRCAPDKIEVQLAPAPLSMILRMSGVSGQSYRLPWLTEKEVCLLSPRE